MNIFFKDLLDIRFGFIIWSMSHPLTWRRWGVYTAASHQGSIKTIWLHFWRCTQSMISSLLCKHLLMDCCCVSFAGLCVRWTWPPRRIALVRSSCALESVAPSSGLDPHSSSPLWYVRIHLHSSKYSYIYIEFNTTPTKCSVFSTRATKEPCLSESEYPVF